MLLILFFVLVLNIVAIALTYYSLSNLDKKERLIFIAVGIAIIYALTSFIYWVSTKDIVIKEVSELGKNLITFLFVPINSIIILPIFAKSYDKYKRGRLDLKYLKNRVIILSIVLVIVLIIECSYFKDIQNSVVEMIEENSAKQVQIQEQENVVQNNVSENVILNTEAINAVDNNILYNTNVEATNLIGNVIGNTIN